MGLIVVVQDVRGRGASEGEEWVPLVAEGKDGFDTVAWAADLTDSDGNVGLWGGSYLGNVQWLTAAEHPPALKAIAPHITWQSHDDGFTHRGGAVELGLTRWWGLATGIESVLRRGQDDISGIITALDDMDSTCAALPTGRDDAVVASLRPPDRGAAVSSCRNARSDRPCGRAGPQLQHRGLVRHLHPGDPRQLRRALPDHPVTPADRPLDSPVVGDPARRRRLRGGSRRRHGRPRRVGPGASLRVAQRLVDRRGRSRKSCPSTSS